MNDPSDRALLHQLARERRPVSQQLAVLNDRLLMYYAMIALRDTAHYIPALNVAVFLRRQSGVIKLYDVVGPRLPSFADLLPFVAEPGDREVVCWFMTDQFTDLTRFGAVEQRPLIGNNLHLRKPWPIQGPLLMPMTAQA
jgi:hypothetical protein